MPLSRSSDSPPRIVGVLLAAGAGRRYGKPKVLVEGWLQTALGALRDGGCAEVALVLGAARVPTPPDVTAVIAPDWDEGLSASVRAGLREAEVWTATTPFSMSSTHRMWVRRWWPGCSTARWHPAVGLARAFFGDRPGHPVVIARRHWPAVLARISGDQGAGAYLRSRPDVETVDCADLASGQDVDEPGC